ncbi:MAG: alpha/beta fold hydrolase [Hyphomicrobium sp.]
MSATMNQVVLGDLTFAVQDEGEGPAVVLLHGFPDSHNLWRHQVPALVAAGYRVIAPDLRGFGESSKPVGVERYGILDLVVLPRRNRYPCG